MIPPTLLRYALRRLAAARVSALVVLVGSLAVAMLSFPRAAFAHEFHPGVLALTETRPGVFLVHWTPPTSTDSLASTVSPVFPAHCQTRPEMVLDCGQKGLTGSLTFASKGAEAGSVSLVVYWAGGEVTTRMLGRGTETTLYGVPDGAPFSDLGSVFGDYFLLGTEHMFGGWDHLLFVLGLVLLAPYNRKLVGAVTAFTVAHSITLALSVFRVVSLPQPPVELLIALSIVLLVSEAARSHDSLTRRSPWVVAFAMGLLHGLGFAGVLQEVGVPPHHAALALLAFNLGVENGQLAFLTVVGAVAWLLARQYALLTKVRSIALYGGRHGSLLLEFGAGVRALFS